MTHRRTSRWRWIVIALLVVVGGLFGPFQQRLAQWRYERSKPKELPTAVPADLPDDQKTSPPVSDPENQTASQPESSIINHQPASPAGGSPIPDSLNLAVPFTSQAPTASWDTIHEEYCEEASALMVGRYFQGRGIDGPADADAAMGELAAWETEHLGTFTSTTAEQTARMIREVYGLIVTLSTDVKQESIKRALANGRLVVVPAAGRKLGNPYFTQPGPIYHMLIVKGYTAEGRFITNDPGIKQGADFVYRAQTLIDAAGDWNNGDPAHGQKLMLIVTKKD